ncbi:AAA family ATPase [Ignavibacterium sp.]|uniref:AAA family ATPase n=1 Tax=Ignavibacterium sp. TaxID=2651167 RepID=UPI00307DF2C1
MKNILIFLPVSKIIRIIGSELKMQRDRYITSKILTDLNSTMVFVGGARQVGKTTLAKDIIASELENIQYYNWDFNPDRKKSSQMNYQVNLRY